MSVASGGSEQKKSAKLSDTHLRSAAGITWADASLDDWPSDDHRVFCGDLGNEVTDEVLANSFRKYASFQRAKVIRDKRTGKGKGFGFVSFGEPHDMLAALKDMNRQYVGNRPIRVMKSKWKDREIDSKPNKRFRDVVHVAAQDSKSMKKFKKIKPVTGGRKAAEAAAGAAAAANTSVRPFRPTHVPRPALFGAQAQRAVAKPVTRADI